jgi:rod shape-determining protein MreC
MYTLRRWWDRHGLRVGLISLAIGTAWLVKQTQGAAVFEIYQVLTHPFQSGQTQAEQLENAQVQELRQRLVDLESQNQRLQQLLGYISSRPKEGVVSPVIGRSADHWWQQIVLGRGSRDGIAPGSIVSGTGGLVGRVAQVTPNTSRVLLITDPSSQVGVTVSRSRSMGYLRGQTENRAVMEFFDKVPDVRAGDVISTSSFSRLFPSGLPVGQVESVDFNKSPAPQAVVELSAPISSLEWVMVSPNLRAADSSEQPSPNVSPRAVP